MLAPLLWTIFSTDKQSLGKDQPPGKTSWDVVCMSRSVQRALRKTLLPDSTETKLLLAFRPSSWSDHDVFETQRADVMSFATDLFDKYCKRYLSFPHRTCELRKPNITDSRVSELNDAFLNEPLCCLRGGLCWWVRQRQDKEQGAHCRKVLFRGMFDAWSTRV